MAKKLRATKRVKKSKQTRRRQKQSRRIRGGEATTKAECIKGLIANGNPELIAAFKCRGFNTLDV